MLAPVPGRVAPLKVTDQPAPEGRPLSVNVTEYVEGRKLAVMVPAALMVAPVEVAVDEVNVIEGVEVIHEEKVKPELGVANIDRLPPALIHVFVPADGVIVPAPLGLTAVVTWNCFV